MKNSIVVGNGASNISGDAGITDLGNNLIGGNASTILNTTLADNGGPTKTFALIPGSPAIDAGNNAGAPMDDQRGFIRPVDGDGDGNADVDIGAFEFGATTEFQPVPALGWPALAILAIFLCAGAAYQIKRMRPERPR